MTLRIGTAAWALPRDVRDSFPPGASNLARYAGRLACAEINSSFYRPHRRATYERWAASVPADFRFSVKLPRAITHEARLVDCEAQLARFAEETAGLGDKRGPILVQLPPKFEFDRRVATDFLRRFAEVVGAPSVWEPRHASWFGPSVDAMLAEHSAARVAADPSSIPAAAHPGGRPDLAYLRLHGSPRIYRSSYDDATLTDWLERIPKAALERWVIFDNTTSGAATANALRLAALADTAETA
ncbi:DUF72 domain-containing protein [Sphingomonas turrisvirgatae]|uniref:DUF72 domain-containing protein n=1 Tax=Sphingomonas turrisvirgatae TaxID=1888892 RepID=A0A1E3LX71_9SPHN|nr:DUF72 domain-containing protein [Sphingomonas turrisvirgatae]ODP38319.1 hypothetical protein BFL28_14445 [Sphingomonas turrisvirgatae]